jgi:hypothetical protein
MPDSITFDNSVRSSSKQPAVRIIEVDWNADPVALGLVSSEEFDAMRRHLQALKREEAHGLADPAALRALAILNGWPLNPPVSRGSLRFWALIAYYEGEWAQARDGHAVCPVPPSKLLPRERLGREVFKANGRLHCHTYYPYSRFALTLAEEIGDEAWAARNRSFDQQERRRMLLAWRKNHRLAMKASLAAIGKYRTALTAATVLHAA